MADKGIFTIRIYNAKYEISYFTCFCLLRYECIANNMIAIPDMALYTTTLMESVKKLSKATHELNNMNKSSHVKPDSGFDNFMQILINLMCGYGIIIRAVLIIELKNDLPAGVHEE